jgi:hypothetical protein
MEQRITKMDNNVKLSAHRAGPFYRTHGPECFEWVSRRGSFVHIVPRNPTYKAGLRGTFRPSGIPWFPKLSVERFKQSPSISGASNLFCPTSIDLSLYHIVSIPFSVLLWCPLHLNSISSRKCGIRSIIDKLATSVWCLKRIKKNKLTYCTAVIV